MRDAKNACCGYENPQVGEEAQKSVINRIFQQVAQRPDSFCNYLEGIIPEWGEGTKLIYRHYATLYFVFAVDAQESDLGILDLVQGETPHATFHPATFRRAKPVEHGPGTTTLLSCVFVTPRLHAVLCGC